MKWTAGDAASYLESADYVDTAVVPLIQADFGTGLKHAAAEGEYALLISEDLERQLKGRVFLMPPVSYLKDAAEDAENTVQQWYINLEKSFSHIFFMTSDPYWKTKEDFANGKVIYLPPVPMEHMDESLKRKMVEDQVSQIMNIFLQFWRGK
ncbi:YpiF family protein [Metabacillus indicus]|uniref:DUF2487 domain-containing protein n=1 Tax=Metabacillus indicus TaxID=246786 RepID=A0A084H0B8_METID|nr:YpiF family protein [Metabacillus indicus]KEZ53030.1 hypothetical protein GS18_0209470 [Metabacillus indicus]